MFGKRELEVLDLLMQGKSNNQIALELGISVRTVEYHLGKIYAKLEVASRAEAIVRLAKSGLWESTVPESVESGESPVENGSSESYDGLKPFSARRISMKNFTRSKLFDRFWVTTTIILTIIFCVLGFPVLQKNVGFPDSLIYLVIGVMVIWASYFLRARIFSSGEQDENPEE